MPASSLFRHDGGWSVFVVEGGSAARRLVEVGQRNGLFAQIIQGVEIGEQVIIHPGDNVDDGVSVKVTVIDQ